ncbi:MAG: PQQ-binding-like beta-propeller repeat protein [Planctomycetes bacterium]|nr:PQQ-binding-like beta-propeller repeat protein [Planctomycetota bacterium]
MRTLLRTSFLAVAVLGAASAALADELFIGSTSTLIYQGTPFGPTQNLIGACGGAAQSMATDGNDIFIGDVTGRIYHRDPSGFLTYAYDAPNDAQALAFQNGDLLVGGSDGSIARLNKTTGQVLATLTVPAPVTALALDGATLYAGSSFGIVHKGDANSGGFQFWGTCGGPVSSMALNSTHVFLGTNQGIVYKLDRVTQQIAAQFTPNSDCEALAMHLGDLLIGGSDGSIKRIDIGSGAIKTSWLQPVSVDALAVADAGEPGSAYCFGVTCPCGNVDTVGGCANSTGFGARLTGSGTTSVSNDDLVITAFSLPANRAGRFYMGAIQNSVPFGAGLLCTGAQGYPVFRFPVGNSGPNGSFELANIVAYANSTFPAGGQIAAGSTWNFQGWTRDPNGPCGATFNTTNAYSVTFVP